MNIQWIKQKVNKSRWNEAFDILILSTSLYRRLSLFRLINDIRKVSNDLFGEVNSHRLCNCHKWGTIEWIEMTLSLWTFCAQKTEILHFSTFKTFIVVVFRERKVIWSSSVEGKQICLGYIHRSTEHFEAALIMKDLNEDPLYRSSWPYWREFLSGIS